MSKIRDMAVGYHPKNILGSVGQLAGVPTGAIIEAGSNANGTYVKYADGTMICWVAKGGLAAAITQVAGSMFVTPAGGDNVITLPAAFINATYIVTCTQVRSSSAWVMVCGPLTASTFNVFYGCATSATFADMSIRAIAVGRWF